MTIATAASKDISALIELIKRAGGAIVAAAPHELVIGNMVRRVLQIVREETADDGTKGGVSTPAVERAEPMTPGGSAGGNGPSLMKLLDAPDAMDYHRQPVKNVKSPILESINELIDELSHVCSHIAEQAIEHIHANEVILTHGRDPAVEAFLKAAHKKRQFEVGALPTHIASRFALRCGGTITHLTSPGVGSLLPRAIALSPLRSTARSSWQRRILAVRGGRQQSP